MASDVDLDKKIIERGYWIATHRLALEKWSSIALYAVIAITYLLFFVQFGIYLYKFGEWDDIMRRSAQVQGNWTAVHAQSGPQQLQFGETAIFPLGEGKFDLAVEVFNPNQQWAVTSFAYNFILNGSTQTEQRQTFVLPGERKYITVLNYASAEQITSATFNHSDYQWRRITSVPELAWEYTEEPRLQPRQVVVEDGRMREVPSRITWKVKNNSTYSIRSIIWQVTMYSGGQLMGILEYQDDRFPYFAEQSFDYSVTSALPPIDEIRVYPIVNLFDPAIFYTPEIRR